MALGLALSSCANPANRRELYNTSMADSGPWHDYERRREAEAVTGVSGGTAPTVVPGARNRPAAPPSTALPAGTAPAPATPAVPAQITDSTGAPPVPVNPPTTAGAATPAPDVAAPAPAPDATPAPAGPGSP